MADLTKKQKLEILLQKIPHELYGMPLKEVQEITSKKPTEDDVSMAVATLVAAHLVIMGKTPDSILDARLGVLADTANTLCQALLFGMISGNPIPSVLAKHFWVMASAIANNA